MAANPATNPAVTLAVNNLRITWMNSTSTGSTHTVYRSRGACGAYVAVVSGIRTPYIDYDVSNGEVYAYYIVASAPGLTNSVPTAVVQTTFTGVPDQYSATLTSSDAVTERRGALAVYTNAAGIPAGCGEFQRLQRLRGQVTLCGK